MISELSIIVPVYNEDKRLLHGIPKIIEYCRQNVKKHEIIIVNDGSTDNTNEKLFYALIFIKNIRIISYHPNKGKGYAVKQGMLAAKYKYILFTDIDLSTPIKWANDLYNQIINNKYDIAIGSRNLSTSKVKRDNKIRAIAGKIFPMLVQKILKLNIADTQCGFKMFTKKAAQTCFSQQQINGWAFDAEILYIAKQNKLSIKEIGVEWNNDKNTKLKLFSSTINMIKETLSIKKLHDKTINK